MCAYIFMHRFIYRHLCLHLWKFRLECVVLILLTVCVIMCHLAFSFVINPYFRQFLRALRRKAASLLFGDGYNLRRVMYDRWMEFIRMARNQRRILVACEVQDGCQVDTRVVRKIQHLHEAEHAC